MKANELMLGDWVNFLIDVEGGDTEYDPVNEIYQPMQIVSITAWGNNDGEVESEEGVINGIDQVKPIPLTAEILEKNGFKCEEIIQPHWISEDGRILLRNDELLINSNNEWSVHIDNEDMQSIGYFEITYVNEFQHALKLCKIDKIIEP